MIYIPLIVLIVGLVLYLIPELPAKVTAIGEDMFWVGLLVVLFQVAIGKF